MLLDQTYNAKKLSVITNDQQKGRKLGNALSFYPNTLVKLLLQDVGLVY